MTAGNSRRISTTQVGIHADLLVLVEKHYRQPFLRPIATYSEQAFAAANQFVQKRRAPVIVDMCCGTATSSVLLAQKFADYSVVAFDQSANRLQKYLNGKCFYSQQNLLITRANALDFCRQIISHQWRCARLYILYPNPYPKPKHIGRRWQGHALLPYLLKIAPKIQLRSNWPLYLQEFAAAAAFATQLDGSLILQQSELQKLAVAGDYLSAFEQKYANSAQDLYALNLQFESFDRLEK